MSEPVKWRRAPRDARRGRDDNDPNSLQRTGGQSRVYVAQEDEIIFDISERRAPSISLKGFACLVASFLIFKAGAMVWLGLEDYSAAIETLEDGTVFDRAAAFVMCPDMLSQYLAVQLHGPFS